MRSFKGIKGKFLILFFTTVIIITALPIVMAYRLSANSIKDIVNTEGQKDATAYSEYINYWISERRSEMDIFAQSPFVENLEWDNINSLFDKQLNMGNNMYEYLFIADTRGNYYSTSDYSYNNSTLRKLIEENMYGKTTISDPISTNTESKAAFFIFSPIEDESGNRVGILGGAIDLKSMYAYIRDFRVDYDSSYSFLVTGKGLIFAHPDSNICMKENIMISSEVMTEEMVTAVKKNMVEEKGFFRFYFRGKESLYFFNRIPNTNNWSIITKIPIGYVYSPIESMNKYLIFIGILSIILAYIFGSIFVKTISRPIINLKNMFVKAANGDMTVRAKNITDDEIGQASRSFNKMMDKITRLTYYDNLTGLPNRDVFTNQLNLSIAHCKRNDERLAVVVIGMDKFKKVNDTFGHELGDKLLEQVAVELKGLLKKENVISRIGGDEYGILIPEVTNIKKVITLVEDLIRKIKSPRTVEDHELFVTYSIGISFYPKDGEDEFSLLKNANIAMHRAKDMGGNTYQLYSPSMKESLLEEIALDASMRYALKNNEFILYYQPIVNGQSRRIEGMEALVRWMHPKLGMISPAKFIPIAEENGLIIPLGEKILETACIEAKQLQEQYNQNLFISVNISAIQFKEEGFIDKVARIIKETDFDPKFLKLEITESMAVTNTNYTIETLEALKKMGISISIDDFGTGYSSLRYLKEFAIDNLKIDQSFVKDITEHSKNAAIVSSIIAIAQNLNLDVIAEGVETEMELDFLKKLDCKYMQGYLFSKPVSMGTLKEMLDGFDEVAITLDE
ncbi:MAG: EAL domain-containing protein [Firmicutes bacterium]|nr:EAL domain-containing protein [Bacillota bacterium]